MGERTSARRTSGTSAIRFAAQVQRTDDSTILRLPDDASAKLPSRGQVAVKGVLNGHAFQTVLEPDGRRGHWLKVDKKLRQALALNEGDTVALTLARRCYQAALVISTRVRLRGRAFLAAAAAGARPGDRVSSWPGPA